MGSVNKRGYIYKITLNNNKTYVGMKISDVFIENYYGSSFNRKYWLDLKELGIKTYEVLLWLDFKERKEIKIKEGEYIVLTDLWPVSYNYYYFDSSGHRISAIEKYERLTKEEEIEYHKKYKEDNYDKILKQNQEYKKKNYDRILEQNREYQQLNKKELSEKHKEYHIKNKEKINRRTREWYLKNRDEHNRKRREKRKLDKELALN